MRKLLLVGATAALGATACAPEIENQAPADVVVAQFDPTGVPAVVPSPNDLAIDSTTGLVKAPIDPNSSPAMQEFTRDYLNTLNGFPTAAAATAKIVDLDPASINADSVRFIDMYAGTPIATAPVTPTVSYNADTDTLTIAPPATGWPKGARYAVALVGGEKGLKGTNGRPVVGSATWAFARSAQPLVTCEDLTAPDCTTTTELIPSTETEPAARLADQTASALRLEQLRRAYKPLLESLEKQGVKREDVALLWTFSIVNQPEATFDLTKSIIPFPNDILRVKGADGAFHLNLPTAGLTGDTLALYTGLNTLDGWSTTAPIVSENSNEFGVLEPGAKLDANTLAKGTAFIKLSDPTKGTQPNVKACIDCASSVGANGKPSGPQQLQFVPQTPLDEKTQYAALLTTDLMDERGRRVMAPAMFALVRLANPLVDANGKSTVSVLDDTRANLLEPVRLGFKPLFDGLAAAKIPRSKIALGWAFTTQSTTSVLTALHGLPAQYGQAGLPKAPVYFQDVTSSYSTVVPNGKVFVGSAYFPLALTGPSGTLNPTAPVTQRAPFLLVVPNSASVTGNIPVTIFSHGLTGNRNNMLAIANALAASGRAAISIDTVFHGERSNCAAISTSSPVVGLDGTSVFTSPDQACFDAATQKCDVNPASGTFGRCIAKTESDRQSCTPFTYAGDATCKSLHQGLCLPTGATTGLCEGGDFKRTSDGPTSSNYDVPLIGGSILNLANLFATRDNFRHHVIDMAQLVRVLSAPEFDAIKDLGGNTLPVTIDENQIDYLGQSLGGILGGLSVPVTPEIKKAVLNVPSADPVGILQTSQTPRFVQARTQFYAKLASQGLAEGTPAFDQFIGIARMIMDPSDPQNAAYALASSQATAGRSVFMQYIEGDDVTPNAMAEKLSAAANRNTAHPLAVTKFTFADQNTMAVGKRHGFLLDPSGNLSVTQAAQTQVVTFFATGTVPAAETKF